MKWAPSPPTGDQTSTSNSFRWKKERYVFDAYLFSQSMWLESPITFLHCVHEARMKKIVHLPPPSEKQIYIVQVADSGLYIETWLIWHYFQDWLSICQKSKLSNKTFSSSPPQTKMAIHDIVATTYYLENYDRSKINLEVTKHKNFLNNFNNVFRPWSSKIAIWTTTPWKSLVQGYVRWSLIMVLHRCVIHSFLRKVKKSDISLANKVAETSLGWVT